MKRLLTLVAVAGVLAAIWGVFAPIAPAGSLVRHEFHNVQVQGRANGLKTPTLGGCTMALPASGVTIEAQITNAADFCELVAQALGGDVFHESMLVTLGPLWHYSGSVVSCTLRFADSPYRVTIRNAPSACRWFTQRSTGWHREPGPV
jgi:hypothetical protein